MNKTGRRSSLMHLPIKTESPKKSEETPKTVIKVPKKSYRRRRRATLADLRCIDILKPIKESEDEEDQNAFPDRFRTTSYDNLELSFSQRMDRYLTNNISNPEAADEKRQQEDEQQQQEKGHQDEQQQQQEEKDHQEEEKEEEEKGHQDEQQLQEEKGHQEEEQEAEEKGHQEEEKEEEDKGHQEEEQEEEEKGQQLEKGQKEEKEEGQEDNSDFDNVKSTFHEDSGESDDDSIYSVGAMEIKNSVTNYEISYISDNEDIVNRLDRESASSPDSVPSVRSQSPVDDAEELYETLSGIENRIPRRKRSYSMSTGCELPSITEELERRRSLMSRASSIVSDDVFVVETKGKQTDNASNFPPRMDGNLENIEKIDTKLRNDSSRNQLLKDFTKNALASKIIRRRSIACLLPAAVKNTNSTSTTANVSSSSSKTDVTKQRRQSLESLVSSTTFDNHAKKQYIDDNNNLNHPQSKSINLKTNQGNSESKNLVNTLKQKVKASLLRRNSIASAKPWTGAIEISLAPSFDLHSSKNKDELSAETPNKAQGSGANSQTSINDVVSKLKKQPAAQTTASGKDLRPNNKPNSCLKPARESNLVKTQVKKDNQIKKETKPTAVKSVAKKAPLTKSLSMSSLPIKKASTTKNDPTKRPQSPSQWNRRMGNESNTHKPLVRTQTPLKKTDLDLKRSGVGSKTAPIKPLKSSVLLSKSRDPKSTINAVTKKPVQDKNAQNSKSSIGEKPKRVEKIEDKKTVSNNCKRKSDLATMPVGLKRENSLSRTKLSSKKQEEAQGNSQKKTTAKDKVSKLDKDNNASSDKTPQETMKEKKKNTSSAGKLDSKTNRDTSPPVQDGEDSPPVKEAGQQASKDTTKTGPQTLDKKDETATSVPKAGEQTNEALDKKEFSPNSQLQQSNEKGRDDTKEESRLNPKKKDEATTERKASVNVIRRPKTSLTITIPSTVRKQADETSKQSTIKKVNDHEASQVSVQANSDKKATTAKDNDLEKELESFSVMLGELESSSANDDASSGKHCSHTVAKTDEVVPTEKRFAALSERYNAIMARFTKKESQTQGTIENKLTVEKTKPLSSSRETSILTVNTTKENVTVGSSSSKNDTDALLQNDSPQAAYETRSFLVENGNDIKKAEKNKEQEQPLIKSMEDKENHVEVADDKVQQQQKSSAKMNSFLGEKDLKARNDKVTNKEPSVFVEKSVFSEQKTQKSTENIDNNIPKYNDKETQNYELFQEKSSELSERRHFENTPKTDDKKRSMTPTLSEANKSGVSLRRSSSFSLGRNTDLAERIRTSVERKSFLSSSDKTRSYDNGYQLPAGTSVIAQKMRKKLEIRKALEVRRSRIYEDKDIPSTMEQFNKYRSILEKEELKTEVKTECLSVHDMLTSLRSSPMEMELIALCKECTKTLRTLDALGSLPAYLSPDTIIVNPSGTIKFKHLTSEVKIDDLLLAPDYSKTYPQTEKTSVFSLAVTIWLASDWNLTDANKPSLSQPFQDLLCSMTRDSSADRPGFDSILQTCELLQTDEMTSRERCQALLWECQATKVLDKQNNDVNVDDAIKSQHVNLRGPTSLTVQGFPNSTDYPTETKNHDKVTNDHMNPKPPSPSLSAFGHPVMDPNMVFSPINSVSGNPHLGMSSISSSDMSLNQAATPTFVPIAVPIPAAGPSPMWYMTPKGIVPIGQMGHHPGYFVPLQHGGMSSTVPESDMTEVEEARPVRRGSRPSTPTKSEKRDSESKRSTASSEKSKIPRPSWNLQKPRSHSTPTNVACEQEALSNPSDRETPSNISNPYRPNTPPIKLRSSGEDRESRRARKDSRPEERVPRSASPRLERSRPSSPSLAGANSGSRPSSPVGSRSSSPVSLLISKFEELSESKSSESAHSVSNLLNKFGSFSLLSEDRITRKHFRTNSTQSSRTGPLRPSSAMEHASSLGVDSTQGLSKSWSGQTSGQADSSYDGNDSIYSSPETFISPERNRHKSTLGTSPLAQDERKKASSVSGEARLRLISSLEDLYESLKEIDNESDGRPLRRLRRNWTSMENIERDRQESPSISYPLRKSTSEGNLKNDESTENRNLNFERGRNARTIYSERGRQKPWLHEKSSESVGKAEVPHPKNDQTLNDFSKASNISDLLRKLGRHSETDRDMNTKTAFLQPERDYNPELHHRFDIPVAMAVMDGEGERRGHSSFSPTLFSPTAGFKDTGFFQHPVKLEKVPPPISPPAPLSPSVKDFKPTNFFTNLSFTSQEMKPERDTGLDTNIDNQNNWIEKSSKTDKKIPQKSNSIDNQSMEGDTDETRTSRSKTRHSSSSGSSSGKSSERRGSNSSKVSSGYQSDYLDRYEQKITRASSTNSEDEPENLRKFHHRYSSNPTSENDDENTNTRKEKERSSRPVLLNTPLKKSSSSTNVSTSATQTHKTKPSSVPSTPTERHSGSSVTTCNNKTSRGSASLPSTPNVENKSKPFFKYVSPNSSLKKSSSRPPSSEPSPNGNRRSVKENRFDFSERALQDKITDLKASCTRHSPPASVERGPNLSSSPGKNGSSDFKSLPSPIETRKTMSPTEPRSPTSPVSSSSSSSSLSPRFPTNKFIFYNPQSESARERHFSPTEHVKNSVQKRYVITDTSRQKNTSKPKIKENSDFHSHGIPVVGNSEAIKAETKSEIKESLPRENKGDQTSADTSGQTLTSQKTDVNKNVIRKTFSDPEDKHKQKSTESKTLRNAVPFIPKAAASSQLSQKDVQQQRALREHRRGSLDLREIYHEARRSSLAPRIDSSNSAVSLESQVGRPKSISPQRPPSPGRVDSRELLGHFVKKVLNSTKSSPNSPRGDSKERSTTTSSVNAGQNNEPSSDPTRLKTSSYERKAQTPFKEEVLAKTSEERNKTSPGAEKRRVSFERKPNGQTQRASVENEEQFHAASTYKRNPSLERKPEEKSEIYKKRNSLDKREKVVQEKVAVQSEQTTSASGTDGLVNPDKSKERRRQSIESSGGKDILTKLVDMIHDEFAFDGYLDDGIEDVNMAEYVISLAGMDEAMFKESISDQYSDLYWDDDLLQDMYILVNKSLETRRPTLRFSESNAGQLKRPESLLSLDSYGESSRLNPISRTSSERSFVETRDYVMSSLGEPSQFLPFKVIAPEMTRDIIEELGPVFDDYQKVMKIKLSPSISELLEKLGAKILEIGQQLTLERRAKRKNIKSFNKVSDVDNKKEVKDLANKLLQEIEECDKKIIYLKYIQRRLRNIYAERFGLDHSLLNSFITTYGESSIALEPKRQNSCLSFSPLWDQRSNLSPECHGESTRGPVLQYGTRQGLLSYLFARHAMSQAYVRYFLYTYRYCSTPGDVFEFIKDKCRASLRVDSNKGYNHQLQIRYRALDILAEWVHSCYQFDFKAQPDLLDRLLIFLNEELIPVDRTERGAILIELITEKQRKADEEQTDETSDTTAVLQTDENQGLPTEKDSPRKNKRKSKSPVQCFKRGSPQTSSMYKPTLHLKAMSVIDHSSRTIAEQLTLIQQDIFSQVHSIHFLNSRNLGIGVGRSSPTKEVRQQDSMLGFTAGRRRSLSAEKSVDSLQNKNGQNLFEGEPITDGLLEDLIMHAQDVSMWIGVEICSAPSVKNQLVLIQKYISVAKYCSEMRNFATCVQIVDALEMFVIRQLPVWKQVPSKTIQTLDELKAIKVILKTDSSWLVKDDTHREKPTIPCSLLFLMHVQQLELGGFTLTNGMYKWTKMRAIARLVDQIRLFKQMRYAFESNDQLAGRLRARILECREENLHALAAENAANFHLSSSQGSRKFHEAFKKMKATFGNG